jgi:endonuclease I
MSGVNYGNARYAAPYTDTDPNNPSNILLIYNRASVSSNWDGGGTWNREHIWPQSRLGASASNGSTNIASDLFNLRPANPSINSSRSNKPFGNDTSSGSFGAVSGGNYYPGDADAGDVARAQFYMATRYTQLTLTDSTPAGLQMGDLSSLINFHFKDAPDDFERRRNHAIYGLAGENSPASANPYKQRNRNPYVDHPEYVWSVFVDQQNDSQLSIGGGTLGGDGGSTRNVDLGRVFIGGAVPAAQKFTLNKGGSDGTYFEVTASGSATSSISGRMNAFRTNQTDSKLITVGLNTSTTTAGLKNGTVTVDNLDITTGGGAGHGANDANDLFNVSLAVLDHATPSFVGQSEVASLMYDFGTVALGSSAPMFSFDVFNYATTPVYTADLDFDSLMSTGDTTQLSTNLVGAAGSLVLDPDANQGFTATFDTSSIGMFSATYTLMFSDEDMPGALNSSLTLTLTGAVEAALLAGDYNDDGFVDAADYTVWRNSLGGAGTLLNETETIGTVDGDDYLAWKANYGMSINPGSGGLSQVAISVPEPSFLALASIAVILSATTYRR